MKIIISFYNAWHCVEIASGLLQYFKLKNQKEPLPSYLPDPNGPLSQKVPSSGIASANTCVSKLPFVDSDTGEGSSTTTPATHGPYAVLTPTQKFEIGKRAAENGTTAAIRYYGGWFRALLDHFSLISHFSALISWLFLISY